MTASDPNGGYAVGTGRMGVVVIWIFINNFPFSGSYETPCPLRMLIASCATADRRAF
jgi:hypothetical protein